MSALESLIPFALAEFGPLLVFWAFAFAFGLKAAIAASLLTILADSALRLWRGKPFTRLYLVVSGLTLAFGLVDLCVATPFLLVYEAPITNALTGAAFVYGAFGETPMLEDVARARPGADFPRNGEVRRFFRLLTLAWAAYFFAKAALYLYLAAILPMAQALALRSAIGGISLGLMSLVSITQGRRLFRMCRRFGWLRGAA
jgi:intracellular septation protein A